MHTMYLCCGAQRSRLHERVLSHTTTYVDPNALGKKKAAENVVRSCRLLHTFAGTID